MLYRHHIFSSVARANTDSVACGFRCNLADHAATACAIESVDAESVDLQQVDGRYRPELPGRIVDAGRPNGRPGAFRSLRTM